MGRIFYIQIKEILCKYYGKEIIYRSAKRNLFKLKQNFAHYYFDWV